MTNSKHKLLNLQLCAKMIDSAAHLPLCGTAVKGAKIIPNWPCVSSRAGWRPISLVRV